MMRQPIPFSRTRRHGFLFVEILIAIGFFVIAGGLTLRLMQARIDLERASDDRLRCQLAMENAVVRLNNVADENLVAEANRLADESGANWTIRMDPFQTNDRRGKHLVLQCDMNREVLRVHAWRIEPQP